MSVCVVVPLDAVTGADAERVASLRASLRREVEVLLVSTRRLAAPRGTRGVRSAGPTVSQRVVAAAAATGARWLAWCPLARVGLADRFELQAGIGAARGARAVTCGVMGAPRASVRGEGPGDELWCPEPAAVWHGRVDVDTLVFESGMVPDLPPSTEVGAGALAAIATNAALGGNLLHVRHPVAGPRPPVAPATTAALRMLREEAEGARVLQELCGALEVVHASGSPSRDAWLQQLVPPMVRASEAWVRARRQLDLLPVRPAWERRS